MRDASSSTVTLARSVSMGIGSIDCNRASPTILLDLPAILYDGGTFPMRKLIVSLLLLSAAPAPGYEFHNNLGVAGMAVDAAGNVYLTGTELSFLGPVFSQTSVLIKLNDAGTPVYTTHIEQDLQLGGIIVSGVAVDASGSIY